MILDGNRFNFFLNLKRKILNILLTNSIYKLTEQNEQLKQQLWNIANTLRGKMDADDFRDYILGFIFYKYLSRKMEMYGNEILEPDGITFSEVEGHAQEAELIEALRDAALDKLGYFLLPSELFSELAKRGNSGGKHSQCCGKFQHFAPRR